MRQVWTADISELINGALKLILEGLEFNVWTLEIDGMRDVVSGNVDYTHSR